MSGKERRADDKRLFQLCERFEQHVQRFEEYKVAEGEKFDRLIEAQQTNTTAIADITGSLSVLVNDTHDIVQITKDFQGAARVGKGVQGFLIWCMKWGAIGTGVATAVLWIAEHFKN